MTIYLLDTDVASESMRPQPDAKVASFLAEVRDTALSAISLHELIFGAERPPNGARRETIVAAIENLRLTYSDSIFPVREAEAIRSGMLRAAAARRGSTLHFADSLIAATAIVNECVLVTRNLRDFQGLEINLVNPFSN